MNRLSGNSYKDKKGALYFFKGRAVIVCALLSVLFFSTDTLAAETVDLSKAINYALTTNKELRRSALRIKSGSLGIRGAEADFKFRVRPEASADYSNGKASLGYGLGVSKKLDFGTDLSATTAVSRDTDADLHRSSIRLQVSQPIFRNFGPLVHREQIVQATNKLKTVRRRYELQKTDLIVEVVQTYEGILELKRLVGSDKESYKRMDGLYRVTKTKELLGRTTHIDTLRVELLRGQAKSRLEGNRERLASLRSDFAILLGFNPGKEFVLKPTPELEFSMPQPGEAVKIALENRLDYAQVIQDHADALRQVKIAKRRLLPDLNLFAGHEWTGEDTDAGRALRLDESIWFVGVNVNSELNRAREKAALGEARINKESAFGTIEIIELSIARQVQQHLLKYRRASTEVKIAERNFELARGRAKLARRLFELGRGDNFTVTDAEEAYLRAENQLFSARSEVSISNYRLFRTLGTLVEIPEELRPKRVKRQI
ncbi:MAG: TolC family protein [Thermodesulfobacteriota bacterium]